MKLYRRSLIANSILQLMTPAIIKSRVLMPISTNIKQIVTVINCFVDSKGHLVFRFLDKTMFDAGKIFL